MNFNDIHKLQKDNDIQFVSIIFSDMFGSPQHFTLPISRLEEDLFKSGIMFDGSSVRAWQSIDQSDMTLIPEMETAFIDPFRNHATLNFYGHIIDPRTGARYGKDPRSILHSALSYLKKSDLGDIAYFGPEPEFFVFDEVRHASQPWSSFYEINSEEGHWTSGDEGSLSNKVAIKGGYAPQSPIDTLVDFRDEVSLNLNKVGILSELHHHEVASAGQCEIGMHLGDAMTAADQVQKLKYIVKNTATRYGKTATFMPKPIFEDNGSGMHIHFSIWKNNQNQFHGNSYAGLSDMALHAIGGILKYGKEIQAFTNATANSYKRLVPGYEAPVKLAYSQTNRSASVRIPFATSEKAKRFEFRCPDASGSPYLSFAAMMMAAIDGIKNKIDPGKAVDADLYTMPKAELDKIPSTCKNQEEALTSLLDNSSWLEAGNVFSREMIEDYANFRLENEVMPLNLRPNPHEFNLYYNV